MLINDDTLEYLGQKFEDDKIYEKRGIPFAVYLDMWENNRDHEIFN